MREEEAGGGGTREGGARAYCASILQLKLNLKLLQRVDPFYKVH